MKTLIATVALATLMAAPVFAQAPSTNVASGTIVNPNAVLGPGGRLIGVDPDPFIRSEIMRDISKPYK
jgi:hypothetical protein